MRPFEHLAETLYRYLSAMGDQRIIDQRTKELLDLEKEIARKQALSGNAKIEDLGTLTHSEQIRLLKALILQKVANNESAEEAITALSLIENKPPHTIKHDHLYGIPILSEIGDVLRMATLAGLLVGGAMLVILGVNPRFCGEQNGSQFCEQVNSVYKYFYNPEEN